MAELTRPEICVIGAGHGGLSVAAAAASFDVSVVLIEKAEMGVESLQKSGSMPAQALRVAAARANAVRTGARFGLKAPRFAADFAAANARIADVIGTVASNVTRARIGGLGVEVVKGTARFIDPETVVAGGRTIKARRFVIATGSSPFIPPIPGLLDTPHLTTEMVSTLAESPRHLIVIGAGAAGLELAQAFRRLGADVTVLEAGTPLAEYDRECAAVVLHVLEREGIKLRTGVEIAKVARSLGKIRVVLAEPQALHGTEAVEGSHLLVAAGRRPNVDDLNLQAAGIDYGQHGIIVDQRLTTTNKRVFAVGDVIGGPNFAHRASHHAALVIRRALFRLPIRLDPHAVPRVVYTDPELAHVGLSEADAQAQKRAIRVLRWPYRENDRAQSERATAGHIKVITDGKGDILGATIVGAQAAESITAWTLAISQGLNIRDFASLVVPYPTYAEVGKRAAITYFTSSLTSRRVRRIMAWLRRVG
jgi:pyruvate/2-oxoglutarate dehydrogenase complex dihydrolipoamide dehydrogenase (E3) component